jgi:very-short-patch-repair endonuclease
VLRAVIAEHAPGSTWTRTRLEEAFLAICRDGGLPQPEVNVWIPLEPTGYEADFLWRSRRLIVETDGRDVHAARRAFERDRERDQRLMVVRFTRNQVVRSPGEVHATMLALLSVVA